jgi:hypothetical protein
MMVHVTQAKRSLTALLARGLPALLLFADAEANDGITTPPPYEIFTTDKQSLNGYPSIEIIATNSASTVDSHAQVYRHRVVVSFTITGDDEEVLTAHVERYMWAIRHLARDTEFDVPAITGPIDTGGEQYSPLDRRTSAGVEMPFVKAGFIELLVTTVE